jgi:uncharacterized OB-fold protein
MTNLGDNAEFVPFKEGLFIVENGRPLLLGNKCSGCGQIYFPARTHCLDCFETNMESVKIGSKGTLYSFTVVHMPSPHFAPPYTVGWIDVTEGIRVFSPILIKEGEKLQVGMKMELEVDELWKETEKSVVGYRYKSC